jgi:DNA polymerase-1
LSQDWGVTVVEAKQEIDAWYRDRPEVLDWQKNTIARANELGYTRTLMGRYRM